jgi:hypothetical protein
MPAGPAKFVKTGGQGRIFNITFFLANQYQHLNHLWKWETWKSTPVKLGYDILPMGDIISHKN